MSDPRVQAVLKRSRHWFIYFHIQPRLLRISKRTIRANGNIFYIFRPNKYRDVQNFYRDKASVTLKEFKYLFFICWDKKNQPLTIDITKDKYTGRYRLGLNSLVVPDSSPFWIN